MKRDEAVILTKQLMQGFKHPGTMTANYHGYNSWTVYVMKESEHTLASVPSWDVPGLFISYNDLRTARIAKRSYVTILYKMGCGAVVLLTLPIPDNLENMGNYKVPNNFVVLQKDVVRDGEVGFKIFIEYWKVVGDANDYVLRRGKNNRLHLAKKRQ